jgi:thiol-disulfide isomerase/thioredoxin
MEFMFMMKRYLTTSLAFSFLLSSAAFAEPSTQPTTAPAPGTYEAYQAAGTALQKQYHVLVPDNALLADSNADRPNIAEKAIPLLKGELVDLDEMARLKPAIKFQITAVRWNQESALYALGDPDTVSALNEKLKEPGREGLRAKRIVLRARWYMAGQDPVKQAAVVADLDKLAASQPTDMVLTELISDMWGSTQSPDFKAHFVDLLTNTMDSMNADSTLKQFAADDKLHSFNGKPMVLEGKLVDGKDFTTSDWKGKVILVDFWATWCVPCRAELPRVQKVYSDYHDKGLEVLGISNDESGKALVNIVAKLNLPWPELFDADAAAKLAWNPITVQHGINGIPVMFLIDKKGICRTVTARDNFEQMIPQLLTE